MFLVPIPQGESFTTLLNFLKSWIKGLFGGSLSYIIVVILIVSAIMSTYDYFAKPEWIRKNHYLTRAFTTTPLYLVSKIIGAVFAVMVVFNIGPEVIISADTGATIVTPPAALGLAKGYPFKIFYLLLARRLQPLRWEMNCVCYLLDRVS